MEPNALIDSIRKISKLFYLSGRIEYVRYPDHGNNGFTGTVKIEKNWENPVVAT